jgi:hypothetical protein
VRSDTTSKGTHPFALDTNNPAAYHLQLLTKGVTIDLSPEPMPNFYSEDLWRSPEHVHLSTGCAGMPHDDDELKRCPYYKMRQAASRAARAGKGRPV